MSTHLTDDPNDPALKEGQKNPTGQHNVYLVLPADERAKGYVRPFRDAYIHVGEKPTFPLRDLSPEEREQWGNEYVKYERYPPGHKGSALGRLWTQAKLDFKCGCKTTMGFALSETYARDPKFYGATFCVACNAHFPVREFVWAKDGQVVGS